MIRGAAVLLTGIGIGFAAGAAVGSVSGFLAGIYVMSEDEDIPFANKTVETIVVTDDTTQETEQGESAQHV